MDKPDKDNKDETAMPVEIDVKLTQTALLILVASQIAVEIIDRLGDKEAAEALNFATGRLLEERAAHRRSLN